MTFEEKVLAFTKEGVAIGYCSYDFYNFSYQWGQKDENNCPIRERSFFGLQQAIGRGEVKWIEESIEGYNKQLDLLKQAYSLYVKYKGLKKTKSMYNGNTPIVFERGILYINELITPTNLLIWSRLVEHALIRAKKHPRNK